MSDHREHPCRLCGSLLYLADGLCGACHSDPSNWSADYTPGGANSLWRLGIYRVAAVTGPGAATEPGQTRSQV